MQDNRNYYGVPSEYELFQPPTSSRSSSGLYFDDGLDDQSLTDLINIANESQNYSYPPITNLPPERNQLEMVTSSDRYQTPYPQSHTERPFSEPSTHFHSQDDYHLSIDPLFKSPLDSDPISSEPTRTAEPNSGSANSNLARVSNKSSQNLVPMTALPQPYVPFFGFSHFNSIQSKCLPIVYGTNHNVVISAPTGSGKTVIFELAMLRMLEYNENSKAVYMAPTKSLCAERIRDWSRRFDCLGIKCVELTGDSENAGLADAKLANIIITTPEKWDSMTRRWFEFTKLLSTLRLVCIDEVHMLNEERGSVLEVIVARMKTLGTNIRLVAVSATVPNICDVAEWLGDGGVADQEGKALTGQAPAKSFIFGEEYRPVKLSKFVYGFPRRAEHTEYQFMSLLNSKLMDKILSHSSRRPTLIFCGTRKSCLQAAETLSKCYQKMISAGETLPWDIPKNPQTFSDKKLTELCTHGIGIHHAGLDQNDRRQTERLFLSNTISVLCTTSTLSVGVNLPARCVIIRGSKTYRGGTVGKEGFEDYSDLDLFQMMGRAGRPQFDDEGVVVVMTSQNDKMRIEKLVKSQTMLESCLHSNLTEHINSEINMGTITSRASAIDWLENSFLSVRIKKNSKHYSIGEADVASEKQLATFADDSLNVLAQDGLIEEDEDQTIGPTDLGEIMSKFCLRHKTFLGLIHMKPDPGVRDLLEVISSAEEYSTLRLRAGEGIAYKALNSHPELRCPLSVKVTQTWHKIMLLIQAVLGGIPLTEVKSESTNPVMEVNIIWQHLPRICKCLVALSIAQHNVAIKNALEMLRSVTAKAWDDSPWVLRQIDQIGEKSVKRLVDSGVSTIKDLQNTPTHRIEMILDRNPPFGTRVVRQARSIPQLFCKMETVSENIVSEGIHVCVEVIVGVSDTSENAAWKWKNSILMATVLVMTNDRQWIEFRTIQVKSLRETKRFNVECILIKPSQTLSTYVACTQIAGTGLSVRWKPQTSRGSYPKPETITDDQAASIDVLKGLSTKDFFASDSEPDSEIVKPSSQIRFPVREQKPISSKTKAKTSAIHGAVEYKRHPLGVRERLKNGRWKCAHRCKGNCHHLCCKEGVAKPPRIRAEKQHSSPQSRNSQCDPASSLSRDEANSTPKSNLDVTNMTRQIAHCERLHQAAPGRSLSTELRRGKGMIKSIKPKENSRIEGASNHSDLPSLTELEELSGLDGKETQPPDEHRLREGPRTPEKNLQTASKLTNCLADVRSPGIRNDTPFVGKNGGKSAGVKELNKASGIDKFRNKTQMVNDFDEKGIFHQRKDLASHCDPLEIPQRKTPVEQISKPSWNFSHQSHVASSKSNDRDCQYPSYPEDENESHGSESRHNNYRSSRKLDDEKEAENPESNDQIRIKSPQEEDEDEADELDEDWDIKIFEGYLSPDSKPVDEAYTQSQCAKRDVDEMKGSEQSARPKRPRTDLTHKGNFSIQPLARLSEDPVTLQNEALKICRDTKIRSGTLQNLPAVTRADRTTDSQTNSSSNPYVENDPDPLMEMVDEVMAWAELHVAGD